MDSQVKNLIQFQNEANHKLQVEINKMANAIEDNYEICFELITTSELIESAKADLSAFQRELAKSEVLQANLNVIDNDTLKFKYDEALNKNRPYINHEFVLENGKYMELTI